MQKGEQDKRHVPSWKNSYLECTLCSISYYWDRRPWSSMANNPTTSYSLSLVAWGQPSSSRHGQALLL